MLGDTVVRRWAADVDGEGRFPHEAVDALCYSRLLSATVPVEYGGDGVTSADACEIVRTLARSCTSTALVYAVHTACVFALVRHTRDESVADLLRDIAANQLLLTFLEPVSEPLDGYRSAHREGASDVHFAPFGTNADVVLVRVGAESAGNDNGFRALRSTDISLIRDQKRGGLGFRGIDWDWYTFSWVPETGLPLADGYRAVALDTLYPAVHLLASAAWLGIGDAAIATVGRYVAAYGDERPAKFLRDSRRLNDMRAVHDGLVGRVHEYAQDCALRGEGHRAGCTEYETLGEIVDAATKGVMGVVSDALAVCGMSGYDENGPYSLGKEIRDVLGAKVFLDEFPLDAWAGVWPEVPDETAS